MFQRLHTIRLTFMSAIALCFVVWIGLFMHTNQLSVSKKSTKFTFRTTFTIGNSSSQKTTRNVTASSLVFSKTQITDERSSVTSLPVLSHMDGKNNKSQNTSIADDDKTLVKNRIFFNESMNGHNVYNYVHRNSDLCTRNQTGDGSVFLLIMCLTAPVESGTRTIIRKTWANVTYVLGKRVVTVFLLANSTSKTRNRIISKENRQHKDICMTDFIDSYKNLTLKTMMGFRWVNSFCNQTQFVLKIDSDTVPNLHNLIRHLEKQTRETTFEGMVLKGKPPIRTNVTNWLKKWIVPESVYPHPTYPPYTNGPAYLVSGNLVKKLVSVSDHIPYIPIEDVYVAMVMKTMGVIPKNDNRYSQKRLFLSSENTTLNSLCAFSKMFTTSKLKGMVDMYKFWSLWNAFDTSKC